MDDKTGAPGSRRPGRPSHRNDATQRILDAAEALYGARDPAKVSVEDIIVSSGVPRTTVYRCFSSKRDIMVAVLGRGSQRFAARQSEAMAAGATPAETFELAMEEGSFLQLVPQLAREGITPRDVPGSMVETRQTLTYFANGLEPQTGFDPRLIVAFLAASTVGWQSTEKFYLDTVGMEDIDIHAVRAEIARLMIGMMALADESAVASMEHIEETIGSASQVED